MVRDDKKNLTQNTKFGIEKFGVVSTPNLMSWLEIPSTKKIVVISALRKHFSGAFCFLSVNTTFSRELH